jgi:uncharacterized protein (TIGR03083 family)
MAAATDTDVQELVAAECQALADLLSGLAPEAWDAPSLCAGWRVGEVVAHLTMPGRYSTARFIAELARARGSFHRMSDRSARRDGALPADELIAVLRGTRLPAWKPPGGGHEGALVHIIIHGLDVTTPLGLERRVPQDRLRIVLAGLSTPRSLRYFGVDLSGVELRADDIGWSLGSGTPLAGDAQDLALLLSGRRLPAGRLRGQPGHRFTGLPA